MRERKRDLTYLACLGYQTKRHIILRKCLRMALHEINDKFSKFSPFFEISNFLEFQLGNWLIWKGTSLRVFSCVGRSSHERVCVTPFFLYYIYLFICLFIDSLTINWFICLLVLVQVIVMVEGKSFPFVRQDFGVQCGKVGLSVFHNASKCLPDIIYSTAHYSLFQCLVFLLSYLFFFLILSSFLTHWIRLMEATFPLLRSIIATVIAQLALQNPLSCLLLALPCLTLLQVSRKVKNTHLLC